MVKEWLEYLTKDYILSTKSYYIISEIAAKADPKNKLDEIGSAFYHIIKKVKKTLKKIYKNYVIEEEDKYEDDRQKTNNPQR